MSIRSDVFIVMRRLLEPDPTVTSPHTADALAALERLQQAAESLVAPVASLESTPTDSANSTSNVEPHTSLKQ